MEYDKEVKVKLTADQLAQIKAVAKAQGMPISTYVRVKAVEAARADG